MPSKDLLEPAKSLAQSQPQPPPSMPNNIQQQAHEVVQQLKDPEIFGIPLSMLKDGLLISSLAFTGIIGTKVFIIDPYINMIQRQQQQQIMIEREKTLTAQLQQQQHKQQQKRTTIDNTVSAQQAQSRPISFGTNNIIDNTDAAKQTVISNDVMSNNGNGNVAPLGINYKIIDNSDITNPYEPTYSNALVEAREQLKQDIPTTQAPQNTQRQQQATQQAQSLRDPRSTTDGVAWPSTQSWPSHAQTAKAQEPKQKVAVSTSDTNSGQPGDSNHIQTEQSPSILEQQLANDELGYDV